MTSMRVLIKRHRTIEVRERLRVLGNTVALVQAVRLRFVIRARLLRRRTQPRLDVEHELRAILADLGRFRIHDLDTAVRDDVTHCSVAITTVLPFLHSGPLGFFVPEISSGTSMTPRATLCQPNFHHCSRRPDATKLSLTILRPQKRCFLFYSLSLLGVSVTAAALAWRHLWFRLQHFFDCQLQTGDKSDQKM